MKARLMTLPDFERGGAWPPSVRTVRRSANQITNEIPALNCYHFLWKVSTLRGPPLLKRRKVGATVGQYAPNLPGYTRATKDGTMGFYPERGRQPRNPFVVRIEGCNSPS